MVCEIGAVSRIDTLYIIQLSNIRKFHYHYVWYFNDIFLLKHAKSQTYSNTTSNQRQFVTTGWLHKWCKIHCILS